MGRISDGGTEGQRGKGKNRSIPDALSPFVLSPFVSDFSHIAIFFTVLQTISRGAYIGRRHVRCRCPPASPAGSGDNRPSPILETQLEHVYGHRS